MDTAGKAGAVPAHEGAPLRPSSSHAAAAAAAAAAGPSLTEGGEPDTVWSVDEALQRVQWGLFSWRLMFLCGFCYMSDAVEIMLLGFLQVVLTAEWALTPFEGAPRGGARLSACMCAFESVVCVLPLD